MLRNEPLFSVVIPTRNRAHLARHAIRSVLAQTFDDYELVVSDNCSEDGTAEAIREEAGGRARYVRPDRVLAMPDHWEFAVGQARGRFVTYLADDDALAPGALARVREVIDSAGATLVGLYSGIYYSPDWTVGSHRNTVMFLPHTGGVREIRSADTLRRLFGESRVVQEAPRMLNSFCPRETLERVRSLAGRIFMRCPDYSFSSMMLTQVPTWFYVDEPYHLQGVVPEGIGAAHVFNRGEAALEFHREFDRDRPLSEVPLKTLVVSNMIADTLLYAKRHLPALSAYSLDWPQYFASCWGGLSEWESNGVDVSADREEFERVLAGQPADVRARARALIEGTGRGPVRSAVRRLIDRSPLLSGLESRVRGGVAPAGQQDDGGGSRLSSAAPAQGELVWLSGEEEGFADIVGCARLLPELAGREATSAAHA